MTPPNKSAAAEFIINNCGGCPVQCGKFPDNQFLAQLRDCMNGDVML